MEYSLTYEQMMNMFEKQSQTFRESLEREREDREKSRKEFEKELKQSRKEFDKKIGEITGMWGKFVAEMVQPKIVELFQERGVEIELSAQSVKGFRGKEIFYEIDILLVNTNIAVAVEVKSTLTREDVDEHLERLERIRQVAPKLFNLSGMTIYGAVAGMVTENGADRYAYKKGLFVLKQKGNIVEIVNDDKFVPSEWKAEY